jgi:hypothetical protein
LNPELVISLYNIIDEYLSNMVDMTTDDALEIFEAALAVYEEEVEVISFLD